MDANSLIKLAEDAKKYKFYLSEDQLNTFDKYGDFLKEYNTRVNLTSIVDDYDIVEKHFLDSLIMGKYIDTNDNLIDVGSGAGFPGVPLKIVNNSLKVTLLDSITKKTTFLNILKKELILDYSILNFRAEKLGNDINYREKYTTVIARAVKNLKELCEYCLPLIAVGGKFISMKGHIIKEEIKQATEIISTLGGKIILIDEYWLPSEDKRSAIVIKKISQTPSKYPRTSSKISKNSLSK